MEIKELERQKKYVIRDVQQCCKLKELHDTLECYVIDLKEELNKQKPSIEDRR